MKKPANGYVAIFSTIIMFFVLMTISLAASMASFSGRMNIVEGDFQARSRALASACVNKALIRIAENRWYTGGDTVVLNGDSCTVSSVETSGLHRIIKTTSFVETTVTNLSVTVALKDLSIISWEELL